jgi:P pilus assembly chaperone PapD
MKKSKVFWRSFLVLFLIAAVCGGLVAPTLKTAKAAPYLIYPASNVVISEFRFRGPTGGNDEFIELYNPTTSPIDISGWLIRGSNNGGTVSTRATISAPIILRPGQYYLVANTGYTGSTAADQTYGTGITDDGGVALTLPDTTTIIDQVGLSNGSAYQEGTILPSLTTNTDQGYERRIGGGNGSCQDDADNLSDFMLITPSDPQNSESSVACGAPTFTVPVDITGTAAAELTGTAGANLTGTAAVDFTNTAIANSTGTAAANATGTAAFNLTGTAIALSSLPTTTALAPATNIVISEFRTIGPGGSSDEFIELHNPTAAPISIGGWILRRSSGCGTTVTTMATIPAMVTLQPGQHYLIGGSSYTGSKDLSAALSIADNGGIALFLDDGVTIVDQVGLCSTTLYREGTSLSALTSAVNQSYNRKVTTAGVCVDSSNNAADFFIRNPSDPQTLSSTLTLCGNPTPTPTSTPKPTATKTATLPPPPPLIAINEFLPRPGRDWNGDGFINTGDEFIEIINHGTISVNLSGYTLDDEANVGSKPFALPSITLAPGERIVFYASQTGLLLSDGGDGVRLLKPNGSLMDAYNYSLARYPDQSFCRLPDNGGLDDWNETCFPSPGLGNSAGGAPGTGLSREAAFCPVADTLPLDFYIAECAPFGNHIWNRFYWDNTGWFGEQSLPDYPGKWVVIVD